MELALIVLALVLAVLVWRLLDLIERHLPRTLPLEDDFEEDDEEEQWTEDEL